MKVVYHEKFLDDYPTASVECPDRVKHIYEVIHDHYEFVEPDPAIIEELALVHTNNLIDMISRRPITYEVARLAVGGAILTSELAMQGDPAFGLIRPPGHHASPDSCWGFCFFNNMAIAIEKLRSEGKITQALILDIDLHFGDGTDNFFKRIPEITFQNISANDRGQFLEEVSTSLNSAEFDIIGVSAGFDYYELDWGGVLTTEDYRAIGELVKEAAHDQCEGKRFALLEGGYFLRDLGKNVRVFLEGMS